MKPTRFDRDDDNLDEAFDEWMDMRQWSDDLDGDDEDGASFEEE